MKQPERITKELKRRTYRVKTIGGGEYTCFKEDHFIQGIYLSHYCPIPWVVSPELLDGDTVRTIDGGRVATKHIVWFEMLDEAIIEKQVWLCIPGGWFRSDRYIQIEGEPWTS